MILRECPVCGKQDIETCECENCYWESCSWEYNKIRRKEARNEGFWLGIGIGLLSSGLLIYLMEYIVG